MQNCKSKEQEIKGLIGYDQIEQNINKVYASKVEHKLQILTQCQGLFE